jgi:hypothetical protein
VAETKPKAIKLRKITIENIKVIDRLELEFPEPLMKGDPDVFVLGSKNGFGKTSVLESCALLFCAIGLWPSWRDGLGFALPINLHDLLIRCGQPKSYIEGEFILDDKPEKMGLSLFRGGAAKNEQMDMEPFRSLWWERPDKSLELAIRCQTSLLGLNSNPFVVPPFLYFHSFRKTQEGSPALADMVGGPSSQDPHRETRKSIAPVSAFKLEVLRSIMSKAGLFEGVDLPGQQDFVEKLNELLRRYARVEMAKLRPLSNDTIDFRVTTHSEGSSFSFDGLSSGQKEIISTLFLIWRHTRDRPGIVLIDEPELHLNHEWHRDFVRQLHNLAPDNQYILATHSEDVFASVPEDRRAILQLSGDEHT